ncbi:hypothetical protein Dcar01_01435 [Deinococcus carri]|uniref:Fimbrial biogenesis outer membrane usher protein n=1 Tax=Deinococcus carri TaxID=1211323 RepID=A0ABP9W5U6_9DEIO
MKKSRSAEAGWPGAGRCAAALAAALLLGAAGAAPPCDSEPEVVAVTVGGLARGDLPVRRVGEQIWVPAEALQSAEAAYAVARAECEGRPYVQLAPGLDLQFDPNELTLTVQAAAQLLSGGELDFGGTFGERLTSLPAFSVAGRFDVLRQAGEAPQGTVGFSLGAQVDRYRAGVDVNLSGTPQQARLSGAVSGAVLLNENWTVGGVVRLSPEGLGSGFSGLEVQGHSPEGTLVPELVLNLPLDATVTLLYEDRQIARFRAPAGRFLLRNLPFPASEGVLLAFVQDARGTRIVPLPFSRTQINLSQGAYAVNARAGVQGGQATVRASGAYGLGRGLTVQGQTQLTGSRQSASASLGGPLGPGRGRVGASLLHDEAGFSGSVDAGYAAPLGPLTYVVDLSLPTSSPLAPSVALGLSYNTLRLQTSLTGQYDFGAKQGAVWLTTDYQISPQWSVQAQLNYRDPSRYGASLGLTYRLPSGLTLGAGAGLAHLPPTADQPVGSLTGRGSVSASYGEHQLTVFGPNAWGVTYRNTGVWPLILGADVDGNLVAQGELGVTFVGGRFLRGAAQEGVSLLVRTGVPGLPVRVSGGSLQRANGRGDLFFTGLTPGANVVLQVATNLLTFETEVGDDEKPLKLGTAGVSQYDWSANFQRKRWVRILWPDGTPAAYVLVSAGERNFFTDLDGNVLIDQTLAPGTPVTVRAEDGSRSCSLTLAAGEEQRCP